MTAISDFRSDTVTRPSARMRQAIASAEVADDVLDGDPTVGRLEALAAERLGKAGALFVPSGTMANQLAIGVWTRPGDELIAEAEAHIVRWEGGAVGHLHGVQTLTLPGARGALSAEQITESVRPDSPHCPRSGLLCLEQTHMGEGGRALPLAELEAPAAAARAAGIPVHLDGARLFHAVVALGIPAKRFAGVADSVSICLSKGLGAPVGSLVAGDEAFVASARRLRKRMGGWMRQSGLLAAAGLLALEENVERLAEDHALAKALAEGLNALPGLECAPDSVDTNIVRVAVTHPERTAAGLSEAFGEHGVSVLSLGPDHLRFVTHLDVGPADVERVLKAAAALL